VDTVDAHKKYAPAATASIMVSHTDHSCRIENGRMRCIKYFFLEMNDSDLAKRALAWVSMDETPLSSDSKDHKFFEKIFQDIFSTWIMIPSLTNTTNIDDRPDIVSAFVA
jgi:hypothetical protein